MRASRPGVRLGPRPLPHSAGPDPFQGAQDAARIVEVGASGRIRIEGGEARCQDGKAIRFELGRQALADLRRPRLRREVEAVDQGAHVQPRPAHERPATLPRPGDLVDG